ncbi:hypothetical protein SETIT_5G222600v2 [Setaria italica]|uniref:Uncharacterized protein n=2 Tax=Setaria italica TaxID=4555 RepID=A0A368R7I1_SETIT|nr:hypothetical protein SETIT_5G222600v2 [Setaria italica]
MSLSPSLLPLKKRALNDSGGGSSPDDSCSPSPKKRKEDAGGREAPVIPRQHRRRAPDAVAAKAKPLSAAEKWLKKGKWIVTAQEAASPVAQPEPPVKKFMQDGIRSFAETAARIERNLGGVAPRPRDADSPMVYADGDLGEALERRLADLGATRPWFVYQKTLWKSDVCSNQNRLLVSCKRDTGVEGCPITACFSADEWRRVENKDVGLLVTALDRDAVPHKLTCKFLDSNGGYRFISGWKDFLRQNGMGLDSRGRWTRDVDVELRAFRSRALQRQPLLDGNGKVLMVKGEDGKLNKTLEVDDHFHPDGSLGLILLHHEHRRRRAEPEEEEDDGDYDEGMGSPVARDKPKKPREKRVAPVATLIARAGPGAEQSMSKVEMVDKFGEPMSNMVPSPPTELALNLQQQQQQQLVIAAGVTERFAAAVGGPPSSLA